jgi:hypothetical protein
MKAKFLQFIQSLQASVAELQTRANQQIASLPPVEQHEAAGMITSFKSELQWMSRRVEELANSDVVTKADEILSGIANEVVAAAAAAGEILTKAQHDSLIEAARQGGITAGREAAQSEFIASQQQAQLLADRRAEVDTVLGANHGITIADEQLTGEGYPTFLATLKEAVVAATENGFGLQTAPKGYAAIVAAALQGEDAVTNIIATLCDVRGATAATNRSGSPIVAAAKPNPESTKLTFVSGF